MDGARFVPVHATSIHEPPATGVAIDRAQLAAGFFDRTPHLWSERFWEPSFVRPRASADARHFTAIAARTAKLVQLEALAKRIGATTTWLGTESLARSLHQPSSDPMVIAARQGAVRELESKPALVSKLKQFLREAGPGLQTVADFIQPPIFTRRTRADFERVREALTAIDSAAKQLPGAESPALRLIIDELKVLDTTRAWKLSFGAMCCTEHDIALAEELPFLNRVLDRYGWPVSPRMTLGFTGMIGAVSGIFAAMEPRMGATMVLPFVMMLPMLAMEKRRSDEWRFFAPLASKLATDPGMTRFAEAVALADELTALAGLRERFPEGGCFPSVVDSPRHSMRGVEVHNPTLALGRKLSVANDFALGERPWAFTGPNSGGKTTFAITACQIQALAQAGARVPAASLELGIADRIDYQAQAFNALDDNEGRFGTELLESSAIFDAATARTLRVFDELAQGTTRGESEVHAGNILRAHDAIGGSTIFITHAFELVRELAAEDTVIAKRIEYRNGIATHRVVEGISEYSGSDKVAQRVGMDPAGIEQKLKLRGILLRRPLRRFVPPAEQDGSGEAR